MLGNSPEFPELECALTEPNGLLAVGGDLSSARLLHAYRSGIFPWFGQGQLPMWWSPDPRAVLFSERVLARRNIRRLFKQTNWDLTLNQAFGAVIERCAKTPRPGQHGTWITPGMLKAYRKLHHEGYAHSVEVWQQGVLIGGIYGIALGHMFYGESMFSLCPNASKMALAGLCQHLLALDMPLLDAQIANAHTLSLGVVELPRAEFVSHMGSLNQRPLPEGCWQACVLARSRP